MSGNNFGNVGDRREQRDPTKDGAIHGAAWRRIEALAEQFGEWAVVADVLASEGYAGDELVAALAKCQAETPTADAWMRQNF